MQVTPEPLAAASQSTPAASSPTSSLAAAKRQALISHVTGSPSRAGATPVVAAAAGGAAAHGQGEARRTLQLVGARVTPPEQSSPISAAEIASSAAAVAATAGIVDEEARSLALAIELQAGWVAEQREYFTNEALATEAEAAGGSGLSDEAASLALARQLQQEDIDLAAELAAEPGEDGAATDEEEPLAYDELLELDATVAAKGLGAQALAKLSSETLVAESEEVVGGDSCCICMCEYMAVENIFRLTCSHVGHEGCMSTYFESSTRCPHCRVEVPE